MFHVPEKYRAKRPHPMGSDSTYGNNGMFWFRHKEVFFICIAAEGEGWEHVSAHAVETFNGKPVERCPYWEEMCVLKNIFWDEEDCVIQYHPPKSVYVNQHNWTLHLWRQIGKEFPIPDISLVGLKK